MKLYVKSWCSWCVRAREYLDAHGYKYEVLDVIENPAAYREMIQISNQQLTPTLFVDGKVLANFGPEELEQFLEKNGI